MWFILVGRDVRLVGVADPSGPTVWPGQLPLSTVILIHSAGSTYIVQHLVMNNLQHNILGCKMIIEASENYIACYKHLSKLLEN